MMKAHRRFAVTCLLLLVCGAAAGCITEKTSESVVTYTFSWWVPVMTFLGGIVMLPAGWAMRGNRFGWIMLIGGPILLLGLAPATVNDRVTVGPERFTLHTGFWLSPTHFDVRFDDLERIDLTSETRRGRRGRKTTSHFLDCYKKNGQMDHVPIGTLMKEAVEAVLVQATEHGIPVNVMPRAE